MTESGSSGRPNSPVEPGKRRRRHPRKRSYLSGAGSARVVLRGARWPGDIAIRNGLVDAVGHVDHQEGDTELRCDGDILTPGLVNAHHHLYQAMSRGRGVDCDLFA